MRLMAAEVWFRATDQELPLWAYIGRERSPLPLSWRSYTPLTAQSLMRLGSVARFNRVTFLKGETNRNRISVSFADRCIGFARLDWQLGEILKSRRRSKSKQTVGWRGSDSHFLDLKVTGFDDSGFFFIQRESEKLCLVLVYNPGKSF